MIDTLKNVIESDIFYMQNDQAHEGWMFINYIAQHWYFNLFHLLIKNELNMLFSPANLLKVLSEVSKVKINESWHNAKITRKSAKLIGRVGVHIT